MKNPLKILIILKLLIVAGLPTAQAYTNYCENDFSPLTKICEWPNNKTDTFYISTNSFPSGTTRSEDLMAEIEAWEEVQGTNIDISVSTSPNSDGVFIQGDGISEIGYITSESMIDLGGVDAPAITQLWTKHNFFYDYYLTEVDILFSTGAEFSYGLPYYLSSRYYPLQSEDIVDGSALSFRKVALHELGHSLGLSHTTDYSSLMEAQVLNFAPHPGSNPWRPLPDDLQGLRAYYPSGSAQTDMGLSNYEVYYLPSYGLYTLISRDWLPGYHYCPDDTFEVEKTTLNNGTTQTAVDAEYYLSINPYFSTSDILVKSTRITVDAETDFANTVTLTIPSFVDYEQTYYVGLIIDPDNTVSETYGSNNTMSFGSIIINSNQVCRDDMSYKYPETEFNNLSAYQASYSSYLKKVTGVYEVFVGPITPKKAKDGSGIFSYINAKVKNTFLGDKTDSLTIRQLGGWLWNKDKTEGEGQWLEGAPGLNKGDHLIIFLGKNERHAIPFVGGEGGVLKVVDDRTQ